MYIQSEISDGLTVALSPSLTPDTSLGSLFTVPRNCLPSNLTGASHMCSVCVPSVNAFFTEKPDWLALGDRNAVMNVLTDPRAFSIAAVIFGSSSGTEMTGGDFFP